MHGDTSPEETERYFALLRGMTELQRLQQAVRLTQAVRQLAEAGIRAAHPGIDDDEVRVRMAVRLYGAEVARGLFGVVPDDAR